MPVRTARRQGAADCRDLNAEALPPAISLPRCGLSLWEPRLLAVKPEGHPLTTWYCSVRAWQGLGGVQEACVCLRVSPRSPQALFLIAVLANTIYRPRLEHDRPGTQPRASHGLAVGTVVAGAWRKDRGTNV